jgi:NAD(P)-dependent dehydrogenase (short-subunit alcohol dehydrogenase family)
VLSSGPRAGVVMELRGKTALVTGGAVRIGRAITLALAQAGCQVAVHHHRSQEAAAQLRDELRSAGARCEALPADLAAPAACEALLESARAALGPVQILVLNAAVFPPGGLLDTSVSSWDEQLAINLRAPFLLSRGLVRALPAGSDGAIVAITDARVGRARRGRFAYQLSKAALEEMVRLLAVELAPRVRVNAVAPGAILEAPGEGPEELLARTAQSVPLGRAGGTRVVADAVVYLLRERFATGTVLRLDGGEYL